jgi:hypothetical protein
MFRVLAATLLCLSAISGAPAPAQAVEERANSVPDFSGVWQHGVPGTVFEYPPDGSAGPVMDVQWLGCLPNCRPRPPGVPFIGDSTNPILKPWAAESVRQIGERWRRGEVVTSATEECRPSGVPNVLTVLGPVQLLQTPEEIVFLYGRDAQVRHVHLNQPHSARPKPAPYGESVGHYEGDTLVVDTIGLTGNALMDRFGTPQTPTAHVVERYRIVDAGRTLEVWFRVEDPAAFTRSWSGIMRYTRNANLLAPSEEVCAENNRFIAIPTAEGPAAF